MRLNAVTLLLSSELRLNIIILMKKNLITYVLKKNYKKNKIKKLYLNSVDNMSIKCLLPCHIYVLTTFDPGVKERLRKFKCDVHK